MRRLLLTAAISLVACTTSRPPGAAERGVSQGPPSLPAERIEQVVRAQAAAKSFASRRFEPPAAIAEAEPTVEVTRTEERTPEAPPPRDYESELRALVGDPITCMPQGARPARVSIQVSVVATESGVISRSNVTSQEIQEAARCVAGRLNSARFRGPVEDAPRTVTTTFDLRFRETP